MIKKYCRALFTVFLFLILSSLSFAEKITDWQIVPNDSNITFIATQNDAPVSGKFNTFTGTIHFDPTQLNTSHVLITVDMNSISASYDQLVDTLKTPDWFNVKVFPQALFKADHFTKINDKTYQCTGSLTIRNKTVPITLNFVLDSYTQDKAHATGSVILKRTSFGIGQGDWSNTDTIKDNVQVTFTLSAIHKNNV